MLRSRRWLFLLSLGRYRLFLRQGLVEALASRASPSLQGGELNSKRVHERRLVARESREFTLEPVIRIDWLRDVPRRALRLFTHSCAFRPGSVVANGMPISISSGSDAPQTHLDEYTHSLQSLRPSFRGSALIVFSQTNSTD